MAGMNCNKSSHDSRGTGQGEGTSGAMLTTFYQMGQRGIPILRTEVC